MFDWGGPTIIQAKEVLATILVRLYVFLGVD
jgi:hypothetical protein